MERRFKVKRYSDDDIFPLKNHIWSENNGNFK